MVFGKVDIGIERTIPPIDAVLNDEDDGTAWVSAENSSTSSMPNSPTPHWPFPGTESSKHEGIVEAAFWQKDRSHNNDASRNVYETVRNIFKPTRKSVQPMSLIYDNRWAVRDWENFMAKQLLNQSRPICDLHKSRKQCGGYPKRSTLADLIGSFPRDASRIARYAGKC